jgi:glycosyltransferase involved in cell wall biosynthesis
MRVLVVSPAVPWPLDSGGRIRTFRLLEQAAKRCRVTLFAVEDPRPPGEAERALRGLGLEVELFPRSRPPLRARWTEPKIERWFASATLDRRLEQAAPEFDLVHLDELLLARRLPPDRARAVLVHHHKLDLDFQRRTRPPRDPAAAFDLWKLARLERLAAARFRHHLTCSEGDRELLLQRHPGLEVSVVPSGFDAQDFAPSQPAPARRPDRLCFVGSLDYAPNIDGLEWFVAEILPRLAARRPGVVLELVGRGAGPRIQALAGPRVELVGAVPAVRPHLERAALAVVPLRIGGGTRLKIVEALALGTPLVSTPIGAEGLELEGGRHLALAERPEEFAAACAALLDDPAAARQLGLAGRAQVEQLYPWPALGERLLAAWDRAARARPG